MVKNLKVQNFFSFKESAEISFEVSKNCPDDITNGKDYISALCVIGANAGGKTNLLKAIPFLQYFCCASINLESTDDVPVTPFMDNYDEPSLFQIEFQHKEYKYQYYLEVTRDEVIYESISRGKKRYTTIVERERGKVTSHIKACDELKMIPKLRSNASIISIADLYGMTCLKGVEDFFRTQINTNVTGIGLMKARSASEVSLMYQERPAMFEMVKSFIREADTGIADITLQPREVVDQTGKKIVIYEPVYHHAEGNKMHELHHLFESNGTKELYSRLLSYFDTLVKGGILVLDELDLHIHPLLLPKLLDLFLNADNNPFRAQILFTCHTLEVMDVMKKYRTLIVEKTDNKSFCFRLDEVTGTVLRNDKPIEPVYRRGVLGGVLKS